MGDVGDASSVTGLIEEEGAVVEEAGWGGVMAAAPWLFSERDVRDLMRLKKPLFLDSRFLSAASCVLVDGPFTLGSLDKIKYNNRIRKQYTFIQHYKQTKFQRFSHCEKTSGYLFMPMTHNYTSLLIILIDYVNYRVVFNTNYIKRWIDR